VVVLLQKRTKRRNILEDIILWMVPPDLYLAQRIILPGPSGTSYQNLGARGGCFKERNPCLSTQETWV
jgi:hypothetical protein